MLQKELAKRLKARYDTKMDGNEWLEVSSDGIPLCRIKYNGQFLSNADKNLSDEYRSKIADIQDEISTVREYVGLYEHAPQMKADGVSDYRQLAAFGDTVLAATYNEKNGFMFCTWKQNADGDSVFWGDYSPNYEYVKESYNHLIPGKEYVLKGALMDKNTGKAFTENGEAVTAETVFTPETPNGTVTVSFTFNSRLIKENTSLVVFETLYKDGKELAVHADIEDEDQTVKVTVPGIGTKATVNGEKSAAAKGDITIEDTVSYKNLTVGKEYTVKGILMDKATGKPFLVNGKEVSSEVTFTAEKKDGEITVCFTFDGSTVTKQTDIVVFETLYRDGVEIAAHADIDDGGQTVTLTPPAPPVPQTGDNSSLGFWIGLGAVALGGIIAVVIIRVKSRKDEDDE